MVGSRLDSTAKRSSFRIRTKAPSGRGVKSRLHRRRRTRQDRRPKRNHPRTGSPMQDDLPIETTPRSLCMQGAQGLSVRRLSAGSNRRSLGIRLAWSRPISCAGFAKICSHLYVSETLGSKIIMQDGGDE